MTRYANHYNPAADGERAAKRDNLRQDDHYYGIVKDDGRYALTDVTVHKHNLESGCMASEIGKFSHTSQVLTGEVFNTKDAALAKVALLNGCAE